MPIMDNDAEMSDDEETKKRSRSKFVSERDEGDTPEGVAQQESGVAGKKEKGRGHHEVKRPRWDPDVQLPSSIDSGEDFTGVYYPIYYTSYFCKVSNINAALLQKHSQTKQRHNPDDYDKQQNTNHNNNYNKNKNFKNNNQNRNNYNKNNNNNSRNNKNNKNNKNNNNNRPPPPLTTTRFDKEFESTTLPQTEELMAHKIAYFLHETNKGLITVVLSVLGTTETLKFVRETARMEENGGMMTSEKHAIARKRSPGGCFFYLVKEGVNEEKRIAIFTDERGKRNKVPPKPSFKKAANNKNKNNNKNNKNNNNDNNTDDTNTTTTTTATTAVAPTDETNNNEINNGNNDNDNNDNNGNNNNSNENGEVNEENNNHNESNNGNEEAVNQLDEVVTDR